jgi:hypothetical protein
VVHTRKSFQKPGLSAICMWGDLPLAEKASKTLNVVAGFAIALEADCNVRGTQEGIPKQQTSSAHVVGTDLSCPRHSHPRRTRPNTVDPRTNSPGSPVFRSR